MISRVALTALPRLRAEAGNRFEVNARQIVLPYPPSLSTCTGRHDSLRHFYEVLAIVPSGFSETTGPGSPDQIVSRLAAAGSLERACAFAGLLGSQQE